MIEIKLSKKWCNRIVSVIKFPFIPLILFHDFLINRVGNGDKNNIGVLLIELQIIMTPVGVLGLYVTFIEPVIRLEFVVINIFAILMIPIGIAGVYLLNTISNNISISCKCENE